MGALIFVLLLRQIAEAFPEPAEEILKNSSVKVFCGLESDQRGVAVFVSDKDKKMAWVFRKRSEDLEIWLFRQYSSLLTKPDRVFYKIFGDEWKEKFDISEKEAVKLDKRIKFNFFEARELELCVKNKIDEKNSKEKGEG